MKNALFIITLFLSVLSCSDDDSINDNNSGNQDTSTLVLSKYSLNYPSGNIVEHNFDGSKETFYTKGENIIGQYEYDNQDRMTKFTRFSDYNGEIDKSFTFIYDVNSTLTSVIELTKYGTFTRDLTYNGNTITSQIQENSDTLNTIVFELDENGYIDRFEQLNEDDVLKHSIDFKQDTFGNYTNVSTKILFGGEYFTADYVYGYIDGKNPLQPHYKKYFLQNLIINGRFDLFSVPLRDLSRSFGPHMIITTQYPQDIPKESQYYYENTFNSANYPTKSLTRNVADNTIIAVTALFTY